MPEITKPTTVICKHCQHGKQTKVDLKINEYSTTKPLEIMHTDLCGTMRTKGLEGELYFIILIDYYTRMPWVCFVKKKEEDFEFFKIFK